MTEKFSRRDFLNLGGWILGGTALTACLPSLESTPEQATQEPKTEATGDTIYIFDEMKDYSYGFIPGQYLIPISNEYGVPPENLKDLKIHLIQGVEFPIENSYLGARIDENGFGEIIIDIGEMEEIVNIQTGHYPNSMKDQVAMSIMASHAFFDGYCHIAAQRGLITNQEADLITQNHLKRISDNENRLIVAIKIDNVPPQAVPTSAS